MFCSWERFSQRVCNIQICMYLANPYVSHMDLVPAIINWTKENPDKTVHDFPLPSFVGSNSVNNNTIAPSLAHATGPPLAAAPTHSSSSSVSGALGGPSSLAELDAVTLITCHTNIYLEYSIFVAFMMFCAVDMCLQADEIKPEGGHGKGGDNKALATHVP